MDIVITTVNGLDPDWQQAYARCVGKEALTKRYRDWGTLPFLMRGIEQCMPFIDNVFLVVAQQSQVPAWVDPTTVHVVLHSDFIPVEFLPTFNSTAIEMFLHRIPGLGEEFIYFNDDFFPVALSKPTDFFRDGRMAASMAYHLCTFGNLFRQQTKQSSRMASKAAGRSNLLGYMRPQHTCQPMLRSVNERLYNAISQEIHATVTPLRQKHNVNQYLYTDYAFFTGHTFRRRISNQHLSLSIASVARIRNAILCPRTKIVCINDVEMSENKYQTYRKAILEAFSQRFPEKSKYEH